MDKYDKLKLDNQLCFSLYALSREVIKLYNPLLDKYNLTYTQYIAMLVMWEEEKIIFKELGKRLHLDSGTLTPVIKKLESMELVTKYRNKEDDRVVPENIYSMCLGDGVDLLSLKSQLDTLLKMFD